MRFTKKTILIVSIILMIVLIFIFILISSDKKQNGQPTTSAPTPLTETPKPSSTPVGFTDLNKITIGINKNEVINTLGTPLEEKEEAGKTTISYPSSILGENHQFVVENNKVIFIKQIINTPDKPPIQLNEIENKFGKNPTTLFGPNANSGINLYVYPQSGFAYISSENKEHVFEYWYFSSNSIEEFLKHWASNYSTTRENVSVF